ncbi:MAG: hypothetical protein LAT64_02360 [Phycisphaerales bacterium]|nr:hypothetical protein [Planctomycetota bacterium]MCH8507601.1 hypothetical protein [Phycisphaerales bacterium]
MMIRSAILISATSAGLASAATIQFAPVAPNGSMSGVQTNATLSADASSFTITFQNNSAAGLMTGFYIEAGTALGSLGDAVIHNGQGVQFSALGGESPNQGNSGAFGMGSAAGVNQAQGRAVFGPSVPFPGAGSAGSINGWAGTFFGMTREGAFENGQGAGQSLSLTFSHDGTFSLESLIDAVRNDEMRLVQRFHAGDAASHSSLLVGTLTVVPLPAAAWAGLGMLGACAGYRAIKRRRTA